MGDIQAWNPDAPPPKILTPSPLIPAYSAASERRADGVSGFTHEASNAQEKPIMANRDCAGFDGQRGDGDTGEGSGLDEGVRGEQPRFRVIAGNALATGQSVGNLALAPMLTSEPFRERGILLTGEQANALKTQPDRLLTSEQATDAKEAEAWLFGLLPKPSNGWWEVRAEGRGFTVKMRWRVSKKQTTQPFPRISREQYQTLRERDYERARTIISDYVAGHLEACLTNRTKRGRARLAAQRLNLAL